MQNACCVLALSVFAHKHAGWVGKRDLYVPDRVKILLQHFRTENRLHLE